MLHGFVCDWMGRENVEDELIQMKLQLYAAFFKRYFLFQTGFQGTIML